MEHLKEYKVFEGKKDKNEYEVHIEWQHGDADETTVEIYPFKEENEMREFLRYIYDIRKFTKSYSNFNKEHYYHFEDGHHERLGAWCKKIDAKYGNKFYHLIPSDNHYSNTPHNYRPAVNSIWVKDHGQVLNIIWEDTLKHIKIDLPKIGDKIVTNTGQISGHGPSLWGKSTDNFYFYNDIKDWDVPDIDLNGLKYFEIEVEVTDCKINGYLSNEVKNWDYNYEERKEILNNSYTTYSDLYIFEYSLLCRLMDKYITIGMKGFDPKFEQKYHYSLYGTNDYYLIK